MSAALDVAIGLILMYLVLSLFCTTINEFISGFLSLRARTLQKALTQLLDDPRLKTLFYNHGLIDGSKIAASGGSKTTTPTVALAPLPPAGTAPPPAAQQALPAQQATAQPQTSIWSWLPWKVNHPSYLESGTVASAMVGTLLGYVDPTQPLPVTATIDDLKAAVDRLPVNSNIRDVLSGCLVEAGTSIEDFRDNVANWFDHAMERLSGSYKRFVQIISFGVCLVVACAFNADTLNVANYLWRDPTLSNEIAQSAAGMAKNPNVGQIATGASQPELRAAGCTAPAKMAASKSNSTTPDAPDLAGSIDRLCALNAELRPLPIGWITPLSWCPFPYLKLFGLLMTAIALTLGAPFWFDLLQQFVNIRLTGNKPDPANKT